MKLRVRSLETKETIRVEIADSSSLLDLKTLIAGKLSPPSSSISPESIALSLNRKDELFSSSPADSLQSLGLTSGDLVFYTQTQTLAPPPKTPNSALGNNSISAPIHQEMDVESKKEAPLAENSPAEVPNSSKTLVSDMEVETPPMEESESKSPSVPCFLKRVLDMEKEEIKGNLGFLVIAVHAVFLESGFVVCDGDEDGDRSRLPKDWNLVGTTAVSVRYTVPELLSDGEIEESEVKVASLKFSPMRNHVSVYGYLSGEHDIYRLHLDLARVVPLLVFLSDTVRREEEKEVFRFWKTVKDRLCLPLLIGICEKNGLPPPPCFARLPTDLKLKVLELLPGGDVARFGCTGSEMKYLASNDELWKQKFIEEFGQECDSEVASVSSWKEKFKCCWIRRRDVEKAMRDHRENRHRYPIAFPQRFSLFAPQWYTFIGGDYDRFPVIGGTNPMGPGLGFPRLPVRRFFPRQCNLGGHSDNFMG